MPFVIAGGFLLFVALACLVLILMHAFRRSVGTGFMVLCIPFYFLYYAFSQFEHPRKGLVVAGLLGAGILGAMLLGLGAASYRL